MDYKTARRTIEFDNAELAVGASSPKYTCPFCGGGSGGEDSFSVTRNEDGYLYHCYRGGCGASGFLGGGVWRGAVPTRTLPLPRPFTGVLEPLSPDQVRYFDHKFGIVGSTLRKGGVLWMPREKRVWMPVRDRWGKQLGGTARSYNGHPRKVLTYREDTTTPFLGWYPSSHTGLHILVEDQVSALKVQQAGVSAVALLGTSMSEEAALKIAEGCQRVAVALDRDAVGKGLKLTQTYAPLYNECRFIPLKQDLKYYDEQTIQEMVV